MIKYFSKSRLLLFLLILHLFAFSICTVDTDAQSVIQKDSSIFLADPAILNDHGSYYLYGTVGGNANNGFPVYTSPDLKSWNLYPGNNGYALKKGDVFGNANFWAPQVFINNHEFYMAYVADENIAIATSKKPLGPFIQKNKKSLDAPVKQIDPFLFIDDDGKKYLYHVRLVNGNKIFVAEMEPDLSTIKAGTLKECITATANWENTANSKWPVTEGPSVIKYKNIYYLFYTANDFRNPDYAVGYATSTSPFGPWRKYEENPILSKKNIGVNGTGHGDFFIDAEQNLQYVFHTHFSDSVVALRRTAIIKANFIDSKNSDTPTLQFDLASFRYLYIKDK